MTASVVQQPLCRCWPRKTRRSSACAPAARSPAEKISVSALRSILLGGVRIDAHQLLRDAEGGLQKARSRPSPAAAPAGAAPGICGRSVSSRRDSAAASSGPEMSCAGVILRPLAISSMESDRRQFSPFQIALKCRARNAELFGKIPACFFFSASILCRSVAAMFFSICTKATSLNKKIRTWVQLVNASLPANRPAFSSHASRAGKKLCIYHYKAAGKSESIGKGNRRSPWTEIALFSSDSKLFGSDARLSACLADGGEAPRYRPSLPYELGVRAVLGDPGRLPRRGSGRFWMVA